VYNAGDEEEFTPYPDGTTDVAVWRLDEVSDIGFQVLGNGEGSIVVSAYKPAAPSLVVDDVENKIYALSGATSGSVVSVKGDVTYLGETSMEGLLTGIYFKEIGGTIGTTDLSCEWSPDGETFYPASLQTAEYSDYEVEMLLGPYSAWPGFTSTTYVRTTANRDFNPIITEIIVFQDLDSDYHYDPGEPVISIADYPMRIDLWIWHTAELDPASFYWSIQAAINAASPGDIIFVYDGVYTENLIVNKALTLQAASHPIIDGGAAGDCISISANNVVIDGFEIRNGYNGIIGQTSGSTFSNNVIHDNLNIPGFAGVGILLWGDNDDNLIIANEIYSNDRQGIFVGYGDDSKISTGNIIAENTVYNNGLYRYANGPDASAYGIQLWNADNNIIENNEVYGHDDWFPYPDLYPTYDFAQGIYLCDSSDNTIVNNYLHDNNYGVGLWHPARALRNNYINHNNIAGNTGYGVYNYDGIQVDARFNWWGAASGPSGVGPGSGDVISSNVNYSPWLGYPFGTTPMTYHVDPTGKIQDAIDDASSGDTILIHSGIYLEALYINKSITLKAASKPIVKGSQSVTTNYGPRDAVIFVENALNVVIEGLDIQGEGLGTTNVKNYGVIFEESSGTIRDCIVSPNTPGDMNSIGIGAWDSSNLTIEKSTIENFGRVGVFYFNDCSGGVYDSTIIGQVYSGEGEVNYGIEVEGLYGACDIEIIGNDIYNSDNTHPSPLWSSAGILIDGWMAFYAPPTMQSSTVVVEGNDIHDNYYGIEVVANPLSYAHCNKIQNNREYGVVSDPDSLNNYVTFDAEWNWWGNNTGPYHPTTNPDGTGDKVSDYVDYEPWKVYPTLRVEPSTYQAQRLNKTFSINITINDLSENWKVVGIQFRLRYNSTLLEVVSVTEGPFMKDPMWNLHGTFFVYYVESDPRYGPSVFAGILLLPNATGDWEVYPSGSGTLATITFKIIYQERGYDARLGYFKPPRSCDLELVETKISDEHINHIPHYVSHGYYEILPNNIADLNWDFLVDIDDVVVAAMAFGADPSHPRWDPTADISGDNIVDIDDVVIVALNFGWKALDC
jgi:nitrous oxidase accessory protein NosD